jgi:hypothetical protein
MKLEDELKRVRELAPETGITLDAVEQRRTRRHRSRQVATIGLAIVVSLVGTSLLVSSFERGDRGTAPATGKLTGGPPARIDIDREVTPTTATLTYGEEMRNGVSVKVLIPGQTMDAKTQPGKMITDFLGWSSVSVDLGALDDVAHEPIMVTADTRIESGSDDLLLLAFAKSDTGTDLMTPLRVPTDLQIVGPGQYLIVAVGQGEADRPVQFAFAVDVAATDDLAASGTYVFSDVVAGPSKAEPEDLALTFTVGWTSDEYPGVHVCRFIALAEDGSIVGEFTEYSDWEPGRYYRDVPGDPEDAATGEVRCKTERLDSPGITDVTPIPHDADTPIDKIEVERRERLSAWALQFDVDGMTEAALGANVLAVWGAVGDAEETTEVWQLTDRIDYLCGRVPSDRELLRGFCD